jgi:hypothetical protein
MSSCRFIRKFSYCLIPVLPDDIPVGDYSLLKLAASRNIASNDTDMLASRNDFFVCAILALSAGFIAHLFSP